MLVVARKILLAAENLEKAVKQLKVGSKCKAIVSDGDLAVFIPSYFQVRHGSDSIAVCSPRLISSFMPTQLILKGTPPFMSDDAREALEYGTPYLQSPY